MSFGSEHDPGEEFHQVIREAIAAGISVVVAAGHESHHLDWPAAYPETISVGAINEEFAHADFSNYGDALDVSAPGSNIFSTYPGGRYAILSGTSMATPIVAGCVALLLSHAKMEGRYLSPTEVVKAIKDSAVLLDASKDNAYQGAGLINCAKLIKE